MYVYCVIFCVYVSVYVNMCMCIVFMLYMYVYTYMCICLCVSCVCVFVCVVYVYVYVNVCMCKYMCVYVCMYVLMYVCTYTRICEYVYMYVSMLYVCAWVCVIPKFQTASCIPNQKQLNSFCNFNPFSRHHSRVPHARFLKWCVGTDGHISALIMIIFGWITINLLLHFHICYIFFSAIFLP